MVFEAGNVGELGVSLWVAAIKQRHFANGVIIKVTAANDLVDVAVAMAQDDTTMIAAGMEAGTIVRASEEDAQRWEQNGQSLWAVVVAPWVLVQEAVEH